jgi:hypothetical protein
VTVEEFSFHRYHRWRDLAVGAVAAVLENVGYRQLHAVWRIRGLIDAATRRRVSWGTMTRSGFMTAQAPGPAATAAPSAPRR